jgi:hypothetical protein
MKTKPRQCALLLLTVLLLISLPEKLISQDDTLTTTQIWLYWHLNRDFTPRIKYRGDLGYRQEFPYENWSRIYFRPGVEWSAGSFIDITGGVGFWYTAQKIIPNSFELRPWQGIRLHWPTLGRYNFDHFARLEERFNHYQGTGYNWDFATRATYILNLTFPLNHRRIFDKTLYARMNAAFFQELGESFVERFIDDRKFTVGLGYRFDPRWRLELLYLMDQSRAFTREGFRVNSHILQLRVRTYLVPAS